MTDFEPCEDCYAIGTCPRCGLVNAFDFDNAGTLGFSTELPSCPSCGWSEEYPNNVGKQIDFDCSCWEYAYDDIQDELKRLQEDPAWWELQDRTMARFGDVHDI
jgi:hypothetical protein